MANKDEQLMELEALESLFSHDGEFTRHSDRHFSLRLLPFPDASTEYLDTQIAIGKSCGDGRGSGDGNSRSITELKRAAEAALAATEGEEANYVGATLTVTYPDEYPHVIPEWQLCDVVGLENHQLHELHSVVSETFDGSVGCSMIFIVADVIQGWLRDHNKPELSMHDQMLLRGQGATGGGFSSSPHGGDDINKRTSSQRRSRQVCDNDDDSLIELSGSDDSDEYCSSDSDADNSGATDDSDDEENICLKNSDASGDDDRDGRHRKRRSYRLGKRDKSAAKGGPNNDSADDEEESSGGLQSKDLCAEHNRVTEEEFKEWAEAFRLEMIKNNIWKGSNDWGLEDGTLTGRQFFEKEAQRLREEGVSTDENKVFWKDENLFEDDDLGGLSD